jgi:hypothetical protein
MQKIIKISLVLLIAISCKKNKTDVIVSNETLSSNVSVNEQNNNQDRSTASIKVDLVEDVIYVNGVAQGTGVYRGYYQDFPLVVSGIVNTIPVIRNGDPVYGIITTNGNYNSNFSESVEIIPTAPSNHFALSRTMINGGLTNYINYNGYNTANAAASTAYYNALATYNAYPPALQPYIPYPTWQPVYISDYLVTGGGGGQTTTQRFTGKLIRSTTGTSTYAIASERYAVPEPYMPTTFSDDCANAINIGILGINSTTISATPSTGSPIPSCSPTGINDDVWFKFTTSSSTTSTAVHSFNLSNIIPSNAMSLQAYSGSCNSLTQIVGGCSSTGNLHLQNLLPNTTYFIRVYTTSSSPTIQSNFKISLGLDEF